MISPARATDTPERGSPDRHRVAVALTFDFDAESAWLGSFKVDTPSALSRGAYGANEGIGRILSLLDKYQLPATFFIPGDTADRHPARTKAIAAAGHEIGHHGYSHEPPTGLTLTEEPEMIERGIDALVRQTGQRPRGYRSPAWELSHNTYDLLAEYDIDYDASQLAADRPYWVDHNGVRTGNRRDPGRLGTLRFFIIHVCLQPYLPDRPCCSFQGAGNLVGRFRRYVRGRWRRHLRSHHAPKDHRSSPQDAAAGADHPIHARS